MSHVGTEPPRCLEQRREQPTHREDCHRNEEAVQLEHGAPTEGRTSERRAGAGKGEGQTMEKSIKCPAVWFGLLPCRPWGTMRDLGKKDVVSCFRKITQVVKWKMV